MQDRSSTQWKSELLNFYEARFLFLKNLKLIMKVNVMPWYKKSNIENMFQLLPTDKVENKFCGS